VSDTIKILKQRISDRIRASDERCIACQELLRQATDLVAMSRDAIARSRDKVSRLEFKTSASVSSAGRRRPPQGADALQSPILGNRAGRDDEGDHDRRRKSVGAIRHRPVRCDNHLASPVVGSPGPIRVYSATCVSTMR
jgi:hypothetical protein